MTIATLEFLSTLSLRRATLTNYCESAGMIFLSTLSLRRATVRVCEFVWGVSISIHALLAESDVRPTGDQPSTPGFLSTLSLRRATLPLRDLKYKPNHFYPRSPCGERLFIFL